MSGQSFDINAAVFPPALQALSTNASTDTESLFDKAFSGDTRQEKIEQCINKWMTRLKETVASIENRVTEMALRVQCVHDLSKSLLKDGFPLDAQQKSSAHTFVSAQIQQLYAIPTTFYNANKKGPHTILKGLIKNRGSCAHHLNEQVPTLEAAFRKEISLPTLTEDPHEGQFAKAYNQLIWRLYYHMIGSIFAIDVQCDIQYLPTSKGSFQSTESTSSLVDTEKLAKKINSLACQTAAVFPKEASSLDGNTRYLLQSIEYLLDIAKKECPQTTTNSMQCDLIFYVFQQARSHLTQQKPQEMGPCVETPRSFSELVLHVSAQGSDGKESPSAVFEKALAVLGVTKETSNAYFLFDATQNNSS